jgi:hypothetical protein
LPNRSDRASSEASRRTVTTCTTTYDRSLPCHLDARWSDTASYEVRPGGCLLLRACLMCRASYNRGAGRSGIYLQTLPGECLKKGGFRDTLVATKSILLACRDKKSPKKSTNNTQYKNHFIYTPYSNRIFAQIPLHHTLDGMYHLLRTEKMLLVFLAGWVRC